MLQLNEKIPSLIKYMGSKSEIIQYVVAGLNDIHKDNQPVCDLFAGSATLSGAIRGSGVEIISNDIQQYSEILAKTYLNNYRWNQYPDIMDIVNEVTNVVEEWKNIFSEYWYKFDYHKEFDLHLFQHIEQEQRKIKDNEVFKKIVENSSSKIIKKYHLFTEDYAGTYWSFKQCIWIDSLKCVIDRYKEVPELYNMLLSCTMYAMAYNSQSTGHYAQFRKAATEKSMNDVLIYRRKSILDFFIRKYNELKDTFNNETGSFYTNTLDYNECIDRLANGTLVYADPPYCSVHYSRFYHILETFVRYDYPVIKYDGRYRDDRYQSPFCIATKVKDAFKDMFTKIKNKDCELVLSYSNSSTTMISLEILLVECYCIFNGIDSSKGYEFIEEIKNMVEEENQELEELNISINEILDPKLSNNSKYNIMLKMFQHKHSRLGRTQTKTVDVLETLILAKKRG
jgi:adenine-specific DNA-methyltransferase